MKNPLHFIEEVRQETSKVTWPTWKEVWITTAMVLVMVALTSMFFLLTDMIIGDVVRFVLGSDSTRIAELTGVRDSGSRARDEQRWSKRWYIVHAYSNFERKVAEAIKERAKAAGLTDLFEEVLVPTEEVVEVRRGRKVQAERKFFPGYVLVKMEMTDAAYHLIKNTPKVTGFLGADNKAMPITEDEAMRILHQVKEGVERPKPMVTFEIGEKVRVADGPFASFEGHVEEVDEQRARLKVACRSSAGRRRSSWSSGRSRRSPEAGGAIARQASRAG